MSTSPVPREGQPCTKANGWGQLSCLEAKSHNTENIKMLSCFIQQGWPFSATLFCTELPREQALALQVSTACGGFANSDENFSDAA